MNKVKPWKVSSDTLIHRTPIFSLHEVEAQSQIRPSVAGKFVYLDAPNWVNVIAITPQKELIMVRQYRHGTQDITIELPAGMCDQDEDFIVAGMRELAEETGYGGHNPRLLGVVEPNPAFINNRCATIIVEDIYPIQDQELDSMEEIDICFVPLKDIPSQIQSGQINNSLVVAAFYFYFAQQLVNGS